MITKSKLAKIKSTIGQILEPIALGILALLFIIPSITVLNLTPITKELQKLNVLGASTKDGLTLTLVEGKHAIFKSETLNKEEDGKYIYSTTLTKRSADSYSKPIIEISNKGEKEETLTFYGQTKTQTRSNISIIANEVSYKIQDDQGFTYPQKVKIAPGEKFVLFLSVESLSGVQFSEDFTMQISVEKSL